MGDWDMIAYSFGSRVQGFEMSPGGRPATCRATVVFSSSPRQLDLRDPAAFHSSVHPLCVHFHDLTNLSLLARVTRHEDALC